MKPLLRFAAIALLGTTLPMGLFAQSFSLDNTVTNIPGTRVGAVAWADCDNDKDLDLIIGGQIANLSYITSIYLNNAGQFSLVTPAMQGIDEGAVKWTDFDNDGDLDPISSAETSTRLYRNNYPSGSFSAAFSGISRAAWPSMSWGDYDNDGDNDLALSGNLGTSGTSFTYIYRNDQGLMVHDTSAHFPQIIGADIDWVDFDGDGDLDLSMVGTYEPTQLKRFALFLNTNGQFAEVTTTVSGIYVMSSEWGDYDSDGDMDLLMAGENRFGNAETAVYRNNSGTLSLLTGTTIHPTDNGFASWVDKDNDGDLDILITGKAGSRVARYDAGTFTNIISGLPNYMNLVAQAMGDYDGDGDLDAVVSYTNSNGNYVTSLCRNNSLVHNTPPEPPTNLQGVLLNDEIHFTWDAALDAQTPSPGLSYRIWIGTSPTDFDVAVPVSDTADGYLRLPEPGPIKGTAWTLNVPMPYQTHYACVQAIDGGLAGSRCSDKIAVSLVSSPSPADAPLVVVTAGPNPTTHLLTVRADDPKHRSIAYELYDLQGRRVSQIQGEFAGSVDLDLSSLPSGIYLLQLSHADWAAPESIKIVRQ